MENQKLEACYSEHSSTIFPEMLGEDEDYQRLKKAKIAAEKALQSVICQEVNEYRRGAFLLGKRPRRLF